MQGRLDNPPHTLTRSGISLRLSPEASSEDPVNGSRDVVDSSMCDWLCTADQVGPSRKLVVVCRCGQAVGSIQPAAIIYLQQEFMKYLFSVLMEDSGRFTHVC